MSSPQPTIISEREVSPNNPPAAAQAESAQQAMAPDWKNLLEIDSVAHRQDALRQLAVDLTKLHPKEAAQVANDIFSSKGHLDGDAYAFVMGYVAAIVSTDPRAAAAWIISLPGELKIAASSVIAREWAKTDVTSATGWSNEVLDHSLRTSIITAIGGQLEGSDEKIAASWAQNLATSDDALQHSEMIARFWGRVDAAATFKWVSDLEEGRQRNDAFVSLAAALAEKEPRLAGEWVEKFPSGDFRDQAVLATAQKWASADPPAAANWVLSLNEQRLLDATIPGIASQWFLKDKVAAAEFVANSALPEHTRNYLLRLNGVSPPTDAPK